MQAPDAGKLVSAMTNAADASHLLSRLNMYTKASFTEVTPSAKPSCKINANALLLLEASFALAILSAGSSSEPSVGM